MYIYMCTKKTERVRLPDISITTWCRSCPGGWRKRPPALPRRRDGGWRRGVKEAEKQAAQVEEEAAARAQAREEAQAPVVRGNGVCVSRQEGPWRS